MLRTVVFLMTLVSASFGSAQASVLYEFKWGGEYNVEATWSFIAANILSADTTIQSTALLTASISGTNPGAYSITSIEITNPLLNLHPGQGVGVMTHFSFDGLGGYGIADFGFFSAFDHFGDYSTNYTANNSTMRISEIGAVPEPATWTLLMLSLIGAGFVSHPRRWSRN